MLLSTGAREAPFTEKQLLFVNWTREKPLATFVGAYKRERNKFRAIILGNKNNLTLPYQQSEGSSRE